MIAPHVPLAPNFLAGELGGDNPSIPWQAESNLWILAGYLQHVRDLLGVPLRVSSGYRTPQSNTSVGGSSTSDHTTGLAADIVPRGMTLRAAYDKLNKAAKDGKLMAWDQLIYYPVDGHIHIGIGSRKRRQVRYSVLAGEYPFLTASNINRVLGAFGTARVGVLVLLVLAVVLYLLLRS